jgi:hypothetical protein
VVIKPALPESPLIPVRHSPSDHDPAVAIRVLDGRYPWQVISPNESHVHLWTASDEDVAEWIPMVRTGDT